MEKTKHTAGEWTANLTCVESENMVICTAFVRTRKGFINLEEAEANAKLISAAPELLEACILANKLITGYVPALSEEHMKIKNAIKKATT